LLAEHETFLADDRIIVELVSTLGKIFYKSTSKRPIPVSLMPSKAGNRDSKDQSVRSKKRDPKSTTIALVSPTQAANEIDRALSCALIHLSPSTCTAVRIGLSTFSPLQIAENVKAVTESLIEKHVPQGWRGVRGVHIKGPSSAALPIWLADELWLDQGNVLEKEPERPVERWIRDKETKKALKAKKAEVKTIEAAPTSNAQKKRKQPEKNSLDTTDEKRSEKRKRPSKVQQNDEDSAEAEKENKSRKDRLKKQKAAAAADFGDDTASSIVRPRTPKVVHAA
jgi:ribosome biogenesis protein UTP30